MRASGRPGRANVPASCRVRPGAGAPEELEALYPFRKEPVLTTPTPPAALTVSADKATYNVGDAIIVTVQTAAGETLVALVVTANATDSLGNALTGTTTVQVNDSTPTLLGSAAVSDSFGDSYTAQGATSGVSQVVFAGVVGAPPAA